MLRRVSLFEWIGIAVLVLGAVIWSIRLEGRVQATERDLSTLRLQHEQAVQQTREDVSYIRERIDRILEALR